MARDCINCNLVMDSANFGVNSDASIIAAGPLSPSLAAIKIATFGSLLNRSWRTFVDKSDRLLIEHELT